MVSALACLRFSCASSRAYERGVEPVEHVGPVEVLLLIVELHFHVAGVADVQDLGEGLDELVGDDLAQVGGVEPAVGLLDVLAVLDDLDDRRVGGGAADALALERLDQRGFGVPRRRSCEPLAGLERKGVEQLLLAL